MNAILPSPSTHNSPFVALAHRPWCVGVEAHDAIGTSSCTSDVVTLAGGALAYLESDGESTEVVVLGDLTDDDTIARILHRTWCAGLAQHLESGSDECASLPVALGVDAVAYLLADGESTEVVVIGDRGPLTDAEVVAWVTR